MSIDLLTLAGLSTNFSVDRPANPGRSMVKLQTCWPWQVYGQFSVSPTIFWPGVTNLLTRAGLWTLFGLDLNLICGHCHTPADPGRSMDTFRFLIQTCWPWQVYGHFSVYRKLVSQTCLPGQVYGHFSVWGKNVHRPADLSRSVDSARDLHTMAGLWTVFS